MKKKYGKRPWIETGLSKWYRARTARWKALTSLHLSSIAVVAYSQTQALCSQSGIEPSRKVLAQASAAMDAVFAINKYIKENPPPSRNP